VKIAAVIKPQLLGEPSRQSAFHANTPVGGSDFRTGKNKAIQAV